MAWPTAAFPAVLDSIVDVIDGVNYPSQNDVNGAYDCIEKLEAKVGVDSSAVATSLDYLVKSPSSSDPGHVHTTATKVIPRTATITSHAAPTINVDNYDAVTITALAETITSMTTNLSGTPVNFQKLIIRIKDNGTARAITWGAKFVAKGTILPTTTVISKLLTVGFIYDTVLSTWGCVAAQREV